MRPGINKSGEVGKHLTTHAFGFFMGLTPNSANPYMGPLVASTAIEDFSGELVHDYDPDGAVGRTDHQLVRRFSAARDRPRDAG